jgi:hypothetical protein
MQMRSYAALLLLFAEVWCNLWLFIELWCRICLFLKTEFPDFCC